MTNLKCASLVT